MFQMSEKQMSELNALSANLQKRAERKYHGSGRKARLFSRARPQARDGARGLSFGSGPLRHRGNFRHFGTNLAVMPEVGQQ